VTPRWWWILALGVFLRGPESLAGGALTVCLDRNVPATAAGFDQQVAETLANRLGQPLVIQWYESKIDMDSSTSLGVNALLSDGKCDLAGGFPLNADALGKPGSATARLPDFEGRKPADRGRRVTLGALAPSQPYSRAPLTIILGGGAAGRVVSALTGLKGTKIGVESGTLADAILMSFGDGILIADLTHVVPGRGDLLPRLEHGEFDATMIDLRRFDAYRAAHPATGLIASGYYHRIGFNLGFVALTNRTELLGQVNAAVADMLTKGELAALSGAAMMTWVPPREPDILDHVLLTDLRR
jgi:ABC-type amino acid transport substrate-binding protein